MTLNKSIRQVALAIRWFGYVLGAIVLVLALFARDWGVGLILGSIAPVLVGAGWALAMAMERFVDRRAASSAKDS